MARVGIFLIMLALIAGTVGCVATLTLSITPTEGGYTEPDPGTHSYPTGQEPQITATANPGWKFVKWTGEGVDDLLSGYQDTDLSVKIKMDTDHSIIANFEQICFTDIIGDGVWCKAEWGTGTKATALVQDKMLEVDFTPPCKNQQSDEPMPTFGGGAARYNDMTGDKYLLTGDFDIRMPYSLDTWPQANGVRVGLNLGIPNSPTNDGLDVERVSLGPTPGLEVYLIDDFYSGIHHIEGLAVTTYDDLSGTLRIQRLGNTVYCYYWHKSLNNWYLLYKKDWPTTTDATVGIAAWGDESSFGGNEVSVLMGPVLMAEM